MLKVRALSKTYRGGVQALKDVSLDVAPGLFGLLGPNGAGKTTLMKILATLLEPDAGGVEIAGVDLLAEKASARRLLGYLPQEFGFYPTLTAEQMLDYLATLKGMVDAAARRRVVHSLLERVNLSAARTRAVGEFSGGMRQRLGIAQALIGRPRLLIVDEPTSGLDPEERVRFHQILSEVASDETIVILSTHIVADVATVCARFAVMREGTIDASLSPHEAVATLRDSMWEATVRREQLATIAATLHLFSAQTLGGDATVRVHAAVRPGEEFRPVTPTLEDYYFTRIRSVEPRQ